jgi:myosin-7
VVIEISFLLLFIHIPPPLPLLPAFPPSKAVRNLNPLICRFYFLDGKAKAMGVSASATANDVIKILSQKIDLQSVDGWALYEVRKD